jgi:hypothetical protein
VKEKMKDAGEASPDILGPTYEAGKPDAPDDWRNKLRNRQEMLGYLKTACRYWYSDDWYGSERRKTKA